MRATSVETLLTTRRFHVERRLYDHGHGKTVDKFVVVHPGAAVILPLLDQERIVMIRNFRHSVEKELLELPAGTLEPGEPPIETARRELIEETGYKCGRIEPMMEFYVSPGVITERMHAYLAKDLTWVGQRLEDSEKITVEIVTLAKAREWVTEGSLRDGKTIAVLGTFLARMDSAVQGKR